MKENIIEILAGPNGSGKSTFASAYLKNTHERLSINSDTIAMGLSPQNHDEMQIEAGRFMLEILSKSIEKGENILFETTLSGKIWVNYIKKAKLNGYHVVLYFVFVESLELSKQRIKERVEKGGHNIPDQIIERRFKRTFKNFWHIYKDIVDEWYIIDNTIAPNIIAEKSIDKTEKIYNPSMVKKFFYD